MTSWVRQQLSDAHQATNAMLTLGVGAAVVGFLLVALSAALR